MTGKSHYKKSNTESAADMLLHAVICASQADLKPGYPKQMQMRWG